MPWFRSIMSRNHFQLILRFLQLTDKSKQVPRTDKGHEKLFKLGDLPKILNQQFAEHYSPKQSLTIDEQMIGTKARTSFLQYMPRKPKKFGIWALCESISGYCLQFQIYAGKCNGNTEHGLAYRVVFDLLKRYLGKYFQVFLITSIQV